ncbi:MAG: HlyD family secretion protein [Acidobacteriota bacterium]
MKKALIRIIALSLVVAAGWAAFRFFRQFGEKEQVIPTTAVRRGDVVIRSYTRGELRAVRSVMLVAPNLFGTVQITRLAPLGALAREKDLIVEFDDSEVRSRLDEKRLELEQIDEQIKKAQAELEIRDNQDQVELLRARYAVRRAELEVKRNELLSEIDATKNKLNLKEAQQRLVQLESDIKSRQEQSQAELAVLREKKNKATLELSREKQRLSQVKLLAPMAGLVAIRQSRSGGMFFRGMQLPDLREGDQVYPGTPVADVLDLSELEVSAKVGEVDRANLREGQEVSIRLDAAPEKHFHGKIKSLSGTASANVWSGDVAKKFDVTFSVDMKELMAGLGAKPEQIARVLETAERNRRRAPQDMIQSGGRRMMQMAAAGADPGAGSAAQASGGPPVRTVAAGAGERQASAAKPAAPVKTAGAPAMPEAPMIVPSIQRFTDKELADADLPSPPEADNQLEVLLRPGLLTDVEIIVEKVPNAIHIPLQAVFEKDGKPIVYVKHGSRFDERPVKPLKRSESVLVIASGVEPGEQVALMDPNRNNKKKAAAAKKGGVPAPAAGAGGNR